jgi:hypothetical protein
VEGAARRVDRHPAHGDVDRHSVGWDDEQRQLHGDLERPSGGTAMKDLLIVAIVAAIVGLLVNLILPPHGRIAAAVVFLLGLLIVLADFAG